MTDRRTLHKNQLENFKSFLNANSIKFRPGKGIYEAIQVRTRDGWKPIFNNTHSDHFTIQDNKHLQTIVKQFIIDKSTKQK